MGTPGEKDKEGTTSVAQGVWRQLDDAVIHDLRSLPDPHLNTALRGQYHNTSSKHRTILETTFKP